MQTITLTQESIRDEIKEKLKNLQKYEQSEEFEKIKNYCEWQVELLTPKYEEELENRRNKKKAHDIIYSEFDKYLLHHEFLTKVSEMSTNKDYKEVLAEDIEQLNNNLKFRIDFSKEKMQLWWEFLLRPDTFDKPLYSKLDYIKLNIMFNMWVWEDLKKYITNYELQDKEIVMQETNAYSNETPKSEQIEV